METNGFQIHKIRLSRRENMIAYTTLGTNDLPRAAQFYDALLAEVGAGRALDMGRLIAYAAGEGQPMFGICIPEDEKPATVGNGTMVALAAENPDQVDRLHAKALELGATDAGVPGVRADAFYIAYVRDLDGNKVNFFCPAS
jgi:catechol 2,3-dioxygenase-like lactoylglutathione lyase family enzyme